MGVVMEGVGELWPSAMGLWSSCWRPALAGCGDGEPDVGVCFERPSSGRHPPDEMPLKHIRTEEY